MTDNLLDDVFFGSIENKELDYDEMRDLPDYCTMDDEQFEESLEEE